LQHLSTGFEQNNTGGDQPFEFVRARKEAHRISNKLYAESVRKGTKLVGRFPEMVPGDLSICWAAV
jgi:hypothetical protein